MLALTLELAKNQPQRNNPACLLPFSAAEVAKVRSFHRSMWGYYQPTALRQLPELAQQLGVKAIYVKDESTRFGLQAFKALGASYAIGKYLQKNYEVDLQFDAMLAAHSAFDTESLTFATTTDGNHGRGVAWVAKLLGYKAVVYMPQGSTPERVANIEREGALVKVTELGYDATVELLAADAQRYGWVIIQDTAWPGYSEVPLHIMQGYSTMVAEALEECPEAPTHIFAQAGVGSMAAAVQGVVANWDLPHTPCFTVLEAAAANCFYRSVRAGAPVFAKADEETIMAGLNCSAVNPLAWEIISAYSDYVLSCRDEVAALGMRVLGNPLGKDPKVESGTSGAIGAGALTLLDKYHNLKTELGLTRDSVVLLFNTEGATCPTEYRDIVWGGAYPSPFRGDYK